MVENQPLTDKYEVDSKQQQALRDSMLNKLDAKMDKIIQQGEEILEKIQEIADGNKSKRRKK